MQGSDDDYDAPLAHLHHPRLRHTTLPYSSSSIAACASASATSVWSNLSESSQSSQSSQSSDASDFPSSVSSSQTSISSISSTGSACLDQQQKLAAAQSWQKQQRLRQQPVQPSHLRQNPRRTSAASTALPSLLRQSDRRTTFVDHLVDASTQIVQAIWPLSSVVGRGESSSSSSSCSSNSYLLPLRTFIQETLRRSRASYSTLQVALYYLLLIKPRLPSHNFTMEQPSDSHACRALQCGRRMFLAALILASKYLQDRNYSARAWSKISGLSTSEINQNETAFLHAVNWRLHITNDVYNRWIDCVNKFNPPQMPPSPGPAVVECFERKCEEFRHLIQKLNPSLDNLDELYPPCASVVRRSSCQLITGGLSPMSLCSSPVASSPASSDSYPSTVQSSTAVGGSATPSAMKPYPATPASYTSGRMAPAMGLLPTPKLAPSQPGVFGTPAAGAMSQMLSGGRSSMCFAVAQASNACSSQILDRWPCALPSSASPGGCLPTRRSSLANSVSTASSPESMISDSSLVSRVSSASSVSWSLMNAPSVQPAKVDLLARHRFSKHQSCGSLRDKSIFLRPTAIPAVREDDESGEYGSSIFASPETAYGGPMSKDLSIDIDATDAARALAELQQQYCSTSIPGYSQQQQQQQQQQAPRVGLKRSRPTSLENSLQDNVRDLLRDSLLKAENSNNTNNIENMVPVPPPSGTVAPDALSRVPVDSDAQVAARAAALTGSRKRLCRTTSAAAATAAAPPTMPCSYGLDLQHPSMSGLYGPGMWQGILN